MARGDKHRERERAFQILYGLSFSPVSTQDDLAMAFQRSSNNLEGTENLKGYAWTLTLGVWEHQKELTEEIAEYSHNWRADRIGRIELTLLQLALYEMFYSQIPYKVIIAEYLEMADQFGVSKASSFMNGILDAAAKTRMTNTASGTNLSN